MRESRRVGKGALAPAQDFAAGTVGTLRFASLQEEAYFFTSGQREASSARTPRCRNVASSL